MGLLDVFTGGADQRAADQNRWIAGQYAGQAQDALKSGLASGTGYLNQAVGAYAPLADLGKTYSAGANTMMGALGVGSPEDIAAAQGRFTSSPAYQYTLNQGLEGLARARAAGGMAGSGNSEIDAMNYAQNLANQNYQQWLTNLGNTGQMGLNATSAAAGGQAAGYGGLANLQQTYGQNVSNVLGNEAQSIIGANNQQAAGEMAGSKNLIGAGLSLASLAIPGGGSLGGSLFQSAGTALKGMFQPTAAG